MKKKIFISWSGDLGERIAGVFAGWLKGVLTNVEIFFSGDLSASSNWFKELIKNLEKSDLGIFCLTNSALSSTWMYYEAGFLNGKNKDKNYDFKHLIYPIQFKVDPTNANKTLFSYIHHSDFDSNFGKKQIGNLIKDIAEHHLPSIEPKNIEQSFNNQWNSLYRKVKRIIDKDTQKNNPISTFEEIDNFYVVIGYDNIGKMIVKELLSHNNQVIVIDSISKNYSDVLEKNDLQLISVKNDNDNDKEKSILCINKTIEDLFFDLQINKKQSFLKKLENKKILSFMITLSDHLLVQKIVDYLCQVTWKKKKPFIISRAATKANVKALEAIGSDAVVIPETTGSIEFASFSKIISAQENNILSYELKIPNIPGSLNGITSILSEWGINIEFAKLISTTPFVSTWIFEGFFKFEYIIDKLKKYFYNTTNEDLIIAFISKSKNIKQSNINREINKSFKTFLNKYNNEIFEFLKINVIEFELNKYVCGKDRFEVCSIQKECGRQYCDSDSFCYQDKSNKFLKFIRE